ncbi:WD40 repeat domain-containing serine/threonine protein kinase [Streptomyces sp. NPDC059851]|uniref:WD40 repeat domain-containing serine/threonine protein kinase n=1 Tax=Streptomyces sp. NPDC059851 TaxID=3346971 RepID=UPI0036535818
MQPGEQLAGRYRLDVRLGHGGMGEVWRAHDVELGRAVAVKVLLEFDASEEQLGRFRREAAIGARLQHPGITVVHDIGHHDDRLFIVMELLEGRDLSDLLADSPGDGLPLPRALDLALQTAEALAAAHAQKVVHRDLKPGNLFLLTDGRLKICDFGIARAADSTTGLTATSKPFGTPPYMAPEQWRGESVDGRCDVYALGCVLYVLLTGASPFAGVTQPWVLMRMHLDEEPPTLSSVRADLPPALVELAASMLAKRPADRPDATAVAEQMRALLREPAVRDVPTMDLGATARAAPADLGPSRRNVLLGALGALAGISGGTYAVVRLTGGEKDGGAGDKKAGDKIGGGDSGDGSDGPGTGGVRTAYEIKKHAGSVESVAFSPDSRFLASGGNDRSVRLWNFLGETGLSPFPGHDAAVTCVAYSPDGSVLVGGSDRALRLYDVFSLESVGVLAGHTGHVRAVAFSPDGKTVASGADDGTVRLWDVVTRSPVAVASLTGHTKPVLSLAFSPDGTLASGSADSTVRLWDLGNRSTTATLTGHTKAVASVAFSPDGKILASGSADSSIRLWDAATRTGVTAGNLTGHNSSIRSLAFSPDGRTLASGGGRTVRLWDVASRVHRATLNGHTSAVTSVAFSPKGDTLASGSDDSTIRVWKLS